MRSLMAFFLTVLFSLAAFAGFRAYNGTSDLKQFTTYKCSTGLSCSRVDGSMVARATLESPVVAATATTITAAQCGSTFVSSGAVEMELPEASAVIGCTLTFVVGNASNFTIDPDAADTILLLTNAAGDSLIADAVGESIELRAISASQWAVVGAEKGTWTDSN